MYGFEKILIAKPACLFFIIWCTFSLFLNYKPISLSLTNNLVDTHEVLTKTYHDDDWKTKTSPWKAQAFAENDFCQVHLTSKHYL